MVDVDNFVTIEEEVRWAVQRLRGHRLVGHLWMHANNLRECLWEHQAAEAGLEVAEATAPGEREIGSHEGLEEEAYR